MIKGSNEEVKNYLISFDFLPYINTLSLLRFVVCIVVNIYLETFLKLPTNIK